MATKVELTAAQRRLAVPKVVEYLIFLSPDFADGDPDLLEAVAKELLDTAFPKPS